MPYLELEVLQDGINNLNEFYTKLQNAVVTFSMEDENSCAKKVICKPMDVVEDSCGKKCNGCDPDYHLVYKWQPRDTNTSGRYVARIEIDFLDGCGKLIVPIKEKLYINIL